MYFPISSNVSFNKTLYTYILICEPLFSSIAWFAQMTLHTSFLSRCHLIYLNPRWSRTWRRLDGQLRGRCSPGSVWGGGHDLEVAHEEVFNQKVEFSALSLKSLPASSSSKRGQITSHPQIGLQTPSNLPKDKSMVKGGVISWMMRSQVGPIVILMPDIWATINPILGQRSLGACLDVYMRFLFSFASQSLK